MKQNSNDLLYRLNLYLLLFIIVIVAVIVSIIQCRKYQSTQQMPNVSGNSNVEV